MPHSPAGECLQQQGPLPWMAQAQGWAPVRAQERARAGRGIPNTGATAYIQTASSASQPQRVRLTHINVLYDGRGWVSPVAISDFGWRISETLRLASLAS